MRPSGVALLVGVACPAIACEPATLPPVPQLVVWLDTDMAVGTYVDTLRVEQLDDSGAVLATREQTLPDPGDWPASFGVMGANVAHLRARAYAGQYVVGGEPTPGMTIDRLVDVQAPASGIAHVRVLLSGDCWGSVAKVDAGTTCVPQAGGEPQPRGAPSDGVEALDGPPAATAAGTWVWAVPTPCSGSRRADTGVRDDEVCIPGGASFLGFDPLTSGGAAAMVGSAKLMRLSPFFLDVHEVTLARWNAAIARGFVPPGQPRPSYCTPPPGTSDLVPVTCVTWDQAQAFCVFDGGRTLPSEAQWHHAASGRGQERPYPWGWALPTCDAAVWGEDQGTQVSAPARCDPAGGTAYYASPVGSRATDTTIDGVVDLAGNVQEFALDYFELFDRGCWSAAPLPRDFVCTVPRELASPLHANRGGAWTGTPEMLATTYRAEVYGLTDQGFRCARTGSL